MIDQALEIKLLLTYLVPNLSSLSNNWLSEKEWNVLTILADLLAPFALVTKVISASNYPTIDKMKCVFTNYFDEINEALHVPVFFDPYYKKLAYDNGICSKS
ncbi:hypothetical protein C1646_777732 [Rhizophagus diaphanus]|nr:hypothetical protein C1646_777732 [Rhizophagus diaphanus] [Rhizophagus sp. MUCL 43196]